MKKISMLLAIAIAIVISSCSSFDDGEIWDAINKHSERISALEELCKQMNSNIVNFQTIIKALEQSDYITSVTPIKKDGQITGYTISFAHSDTIIIYNGEDGKDGHTPQISVKVENGIYYWTLDGEWMLDEHGNKLSVEGNDGVTPMLKIENDYWFVSYDGKKTWTQLERSVADNNGNTTTEGLSFKEIFVEDGYVVFIMNDGQNTQVRIPFSSGEILTIYIDSPGTLRDLMTIQQQRNVTTLRLVGKYNDEDIMFIYYYLNSLEVLDLSQASCMYSLSISTIYNDNLGVFDSPNRTLRHLILGDAFNGETYIGISAYLRNLTVLETITLTKNDSRLVVTSNTDKFYIANCPNLSKLIVAEGVTQLNLISNYEEHLTYNVAPTLDLPSTLEKVSNYAFYNIWLRNLCQKVICRSQMPPKIYDQSNQVGDFAKTNISSISLYVPKESVEVYKIAAGWCNFKEILPIEEYND